MISSFRLRRLAEAEIASMQIPPLTTQMNSLLSDEKSPKEKGVSQSLLVSSQAVSGAILCAVQIIMTRYTRSLLSWDQHFHQKVVIKMQLWLWDRDAKMWGWISQRSSCFQGWSRKNTRWALDLWGQRIGKCLKKKGTNWNNFFDQQN